jgi:hypothetical protein
MRSIFTPRYAGCLSLVLLLSNTAQLPALPDLRFQDFKQYQQFGTQQTRFLGGQLNIDVTDGFVVIAGCLCNGGVFICAPSNICPNGTTGLIVAGDFDGDGLSDSQTFWSVVGIQDHEYLRPLRADLVELNSGPPSTLPRPLRTFLERSVQIYYNVLAPPLTLYSISNYTTTRDYAAGPAGLNRQWGEVVPGTYDFKIPIRDPFAPYPDAQDVIKLTHYQMIEAWPGRGVVPQEGDWVLEEPNNWNPAEEVEMDPRLFNEFEWRGFNGNSVFGSDTTLFSMVDPVTGLIEYPPYDPFTPAGDRAQEIIDTPSTGIPIGPYLYSPGTKLTAQIDFRRNAATSGVARDTSRRLFEWNVYFVDTYFGYAEAQIPPTFPAGTPQNEKEPNFDFDSDGWTNLEEFALQTDPADPASVPLILPFLDPITNQCILDITKRPAVGFRLDYAIERSPNGIDGWTKIEPGDPLYLIEFDNETQIKVRSILPVPPGPCHLRVVITQN